MAQTLYCRWDGCDFVDDAIAGAIPTVCKKCGREARWTTNPHGPKERRKHAKRPRVPFTTTMQDRALFLKRIKISPD